MLTQSEKRWLTKRSQYPYFACFSCVWRDTSLPSHLDRIAEGYIQGCNADCAGFFSLFVTEKDLLEASEFSERVAVKLAKHIHDKPLVCETNWDCPYWPQGKCAWCYLKVARIEVEEEMDNEP